MEATKTNEQLDREAAARLARLACPGLTPGTEEHSWHTGSVFDTEAHQLVQDCPTCQGTGLAFPDVSQFCDGCDDLECRGMRRIAKSPAEVLEVLTAHELFGFLLNHFKGEKRLQGNWAGSNGLGPTPLTALEAAIQGPGEAE